MAVRNLEDEPLAFQPPQIVGRLAAGVGSVEQLGGSSDQLAVGKAFD
jgi:hypothetical protein